MIADWATWWAVDTTQVHLKNTQLNAFQIPDCHVFQTTQNVIFWERKRYLTTRRKVYSIKSGFERSTMDNNITKERAYNKLRFWLLQWVFVFIDAASDGGNGFTLLPPLHPNRLRRRIVVQIFILVQEMQWVKKRNCGRKTYQDSTECRLHPLTQPSPIDPSTD